MASVMVLGLVLVVFLAMGLSASLSVEAVLASGESVLCVMFFVLATGLLVLLSEAESFEVLRFSLEMNCTLFHKRTNF